MPENQPPDEAGYPLSSNDLQQDMYVDDGNTAFLAGNGRTSLSGSDRTLNIPKNPNINEFAKYSRGWRLLFAWIYENICRVLALGLLEYFSGRVFSSTTDHPNVRVCIQSLN